MTSEPKVIISPKTALMLAALIKQECEKHSTCTPCPYNTGNRSKLCFIKELGGFAPEEWIIIDINGANYELPEQYKHVKY